MSPFRLLATFANHLTHDVLAPLIDKLSCRHGAICEEDALPSKLTPGKRAATSAGVRLVKGGGAP